MERVGRADENKSLGGKFLRRVFERTDDKLRPGRPVTSNLRQDKGAADAEQNRARNTRWSS